MKRSTMLVGAAAQIAAIAGAHAQSFSEAAFLAAYETITAEALGAHVATLASDDFEGRNPGTAGERKTTAYLRAQFAAAGAAPGAGRSWFQPVPLLEFERTHDPDFSIAADGAAAALAFGEDFVAFAGGARADVAIDNVDLVFIGYGVDAPEENWNDYAGVDVAGKIVVALRGEPGVEGDDAFFDGEALTRHGGQSAKYDAAKKHGARAVVMIHTEESAGYPFSALSGGGAPVQHFVTKKNSPPPLDLVVHINERAADALLRSGGTSLDEATQRAGQRGFRAHPLGVTASARWRGTTRKIRSHNVIAKFTGTEAPDECVVYTAHWDHIGKDPDLEGDQIFNGAVDNATGTAGLIELAEAFAALPTPPRRSVYLIATTAEEKGLLGADYYADNPVCPLAKTAAVINLDALFPFGPFDALTVTAFGSSEIEDVLATAAARRGRVLQDDSNPGAGAFYRSDHYPFAKRGVPAIFAVGAPKLEDLVEGSEILGKYQNYLENGYHKVGDEYDSAEWDMRGIEGDVRIFFETGLRIADDVRFPNWRYDNQFRALRDAMRAGE